MSLNRFLLLALALPASSAAEIKFGPIFSDHMVMQQRSKVKIWGLSTPGSTLEIVASWGAKGKALVDQEGRWSLMLKTPKAGGPFTISASGDGTAKLEDILIGEVWVCSGQSNMEWSLSASMPKLPDTTAPNVRWIIVPKNPSGLPTESFDAKWMTCDTPQTQSFSAVGYHFAKSVSEKLNVPVGMIGTYWGGTAVEKWMDDESLLSVGINARDEQLKAAKMAAKREATYKFMDYFETGMQESWMRGDDTNWVRTDDPFLSSAQVFQSFDGYLWMRADLNLPADKPLAMPHLNLQGIDDGVRVWVNGEYAGAADDYDWAERTFPIDPKFLRVGENQITIRIMDTGGPGGIAKINGEPFLEAGGYPYPLGNWRLRKSISIAGYDLPQLNTGLGNGTLYNGMIAPIVDFPIRGAIWYQGESNVGNANQYKERFGKMITSWRQAWGFEFPFYFTEIAPFSGYGTDSAPLRLAQRETLAMKNTGMAATIDLVDNLADIHPTNKHDVGRRLARLALNDTYKQKEVLPQGPTPIRAKRVGDTVEIEFRFAENLRLTAPTGFDVEGDPVLVTAKVVGDKIVLTGVPKSAKAIRYAWSNTFQGTLFNKELPAGTFRIKL